MGPLRFLYPTAAVSELPPTHQWHKTEADPVILAEYVATLLKKDKPAQELQKLCTESLVEFLGHDTNSFITKLFQAFDDGSIVTSAEDLDSIRQVESSATLTTVDSVVQNGLSPKPEKLSSSSDPLSDSEEKEITDDDDDDRNHKHRRRDTRSLSSDKDPQDQPFRRVNRKRDKPFENGQLFAGSDPQSSEFRKEYHFAPSENAKFEKRRPGLASLPRALPDSVQRLRVSQPFRSDPGSRFDTSTSLGRLPMGRGRGRNTATWNQHDPRFSSVENLDFSSQVAPPGSAATPNLFPGRGLPNAASAQSASWGAFGLIHGMPNGGLDTLHSLGLQGSLRPPINPSLNLGIPRQRCRDFEERGFCLRGDMCPMEHGVNRIVVEDVQVAPKEEGGDAMYLYELQSLSQFNLPVSIPSTHLLGMQGGPGPLPPVAAASSMLTNSKGLHGKNSKPGVADDGLGFNGVSSGAGATGEADLYDPDQPLWNNDRLEASERLLRLHSPKIDDTEAPWDNDSSDRLNFRLAEGNDAEHSGRAAVVGSSCATSSVWGRIGNSGNRLEVTSKSDSMINPSAHRGTELREDQEETLTNARDSAHKGKRSMAEEAIPKGKNLASTARMHLDSARNTGRPTQKASRTLFVNYIPVQNNKREALLSHFQKFGDVIDIYIPLNTGKAFVQFSKREDAEAALLAPDAVMGNRFIKLSWANRDSIPSEAGSSGNVVSGASRGTSAASVPSCPTSDKGKENMLSAASNTSIVPGLDAPMAAVVPSRPVGANGPKVIPPLQKKLESLELLKEELRMKQEMLDQKRNNFRRLLDKLEKQAVTVKSEATSEQAAKRQKAEPSDDVAKAVAHRPTNNAATVTRLDAVKLQDKKNPIESPVAVLKEHFSSFGDVPTVELEHLEDHASSPDSKSSHNCSARITFTTRRSAERAFQNGRCCQGHNLQFNWSTTASNLSNDHSGMEMSPTPTPRGPEAKVLEESSLHAEKFAGSGVPQAADNSQNQCSTGGQHDDLDQLTKETVEVLPSSSPPISSNERPHESDDPVSED
ncbi:hypothetical protein ACLOJK_001894 [Asimina triloba]